jgi:uncharacterized protein
MSELSFLGYDFKPIRFDDRRNLTEFLRRNPQPLTGYTFATLAAWSPFFHYEYAFAEPATLLISYLLDPDPNRQLLQPIGPLPSHLCQKILGESAALPYPLKIIGVSDRFIESNPLLVQSFRAREDRAVSNYVYSTLSLSELAGRKYAKKRNLLSQASALYRWSVEQLTGRRASACFEVLDSITEEEHPIMEGMLERELKALKCTLDHFDELCQQGLLLQVGGRPVAFSVFEEISPDTAAVHFERALRSYKGLYQVVNWETAKVIAQTGLQFINREEDLGNRGLRDAKLSYHPIKIVPAFELEFAK